MSPLPLKGQMTLMDVSLDIEPGPAGPIGGTALLSDDGLYRYHLSRPLAGDKPPMLFIMLNPSTADALADDNTIGRCRGYANAEGASSLHVVNLFAYRTKDPKVLWAYEGDRVGPENDAHLRSAFRTMRNTGGTVVAAWGAHRKAQERADWVCKLAELDEGLTIHSLAITKSGEPGHPLYLSKRLRPKRYYR